MWMEETKRHIPSFDSCGNQNWNLIGRSGIVWHMLASMWMAYKQQTETERYYFNGTNLPLPLSPLLCHTYQYRLNSFLDVLQQESRQNQREFETKLYRTIQFLCLLYISILRFHFVSETRKKSVVWESWICIASICLLFSIHWSEWKSCVSFCGCGCSYMHVFF